MKASSTRSFLLQFVILTIEMLTSTTQLACPNKCLCYLDNKGRDTVQCNEGGMTGPLTLTNLSETIEIVLITPPKNRMNQLTMSPIFATFKNLKQLHIINSNIPQLGQYFFYNLKYLDILNLSLNNIKQPLDHNFYGLLNLKELYLDDNCIHSLPSGTFRFLQELELLSIKNNCFKELMPRIFLEIKKLKVLKLSGNYLGELHPIVFEDIQELQTLECSSCGLKNVDKKLFELIHGLRYLDLSNNQLALLPTDLFQPLEQLQYLYLNGNRLSVIKNSIFVQQRRLKYLNLAQNNLNKISPNSLDKLQNLTELDLSYNTKLEAIDKNLLITIRNNLKILKLNGNSRLNYESLKELLENLTITELSLNDCNLFDLSIPLPVTIRKLSLADNYLTIINYDLISDNLQELDISANRFRGINELLLQKFDNLQLLKLDKNPWSCDLCYIVPLLERVNRTIPYKYSDLICAQPFIVKGKRLGLLKRNELTWCTVPSYTTGDANFFLLGDDGRISLIATTTSIVLLLCIIVVIIGFLIYTRRHAAKYYTNEDKLTIDNNYYDIDSANFIDNNHSPLFDDERELNFKFPLDCKDDERKITIATIDNELKKDNNTTTVINGTT